MIPEAISPYTRRNRRLSPKRLAEQEATADLARQGLTIDQIAERLHLHTSTVSRRMRGYRDRTGDPLPLAQPPKPDPNKLTPREEQTAALCDGSLCIREIAERLGIDYTKAAEHRRHAAKKLGRELPVAKGKEAKSGAEEVAKQQEIDGALARARRFSKCEDCGDTVYPSRVGEHQCMGGILDRVRSGSSNLGRAERFAW